MSPFPKYIKICEIDDSTGILWTSYVDEKWMKAILDRQDPVYYADVVFRGTELYKNRFGTDLFSLLDHLLLNRFGGTNEN